MSVCVVLQMGDRVGPVGTGEASFSIGASGGTQRLSPVNWSMVLDRQEALVSTDGDTDKCFTHPLIGILTRMCPLFFYIRGTCAACDTVKGIVLSFTVEFNLQRSS